MSAVNEIWAYRTLIQNLTQRELKSRYKKSVLGRLWALINPAASLAVYTLVFGVYLNASPPMSPSGLSNFALWLFAALIMWNGFSAILNGSMSALFDAGGLMGKIYFPPECPAIANVFSSLLQVFTEIGVLLVVMIVLGNVGWSVLVMPLLVVEMVFFGLGLGLMASLLNVFYRDVGYLVAILMQILFYGTPIVYSLTDIPDTLGGFPIKKVVEANPLTQLTYQSRQAMYLMQFPTWGQLVYTLVTCTAMLLLGWWVFARRAPLAIEEI
jgi:ABC-2 type transport system permease protein